jgi:hypothetical protein
MPKLCLPAWATDLAAKQWDGVAAIATAVSAVLIFVTVWLALRPIREEKRRTDALRNRLAAQLAQVRDLIVMANMGGQRTVTRQGYSPLTAAAADAVELDFAREGFRLPGHQSDAVLRFLVTYRTGKGFDDAEVLAFHLLADVVAAIDALGVKPLPPTPNGESLQIRLAEALQSLRSPTGDPPPRSPSRGSS